MHLSAAEAFGIGMGPGKMRPSAFRHRQSASYETTVKVSGELSSASVDETTRQMTLTVGS